MEAVQPFGDVLTRAGLFRGPVALDLSGVDFIDGSGLSLLIDVCSRARRAGRELMILDASRCVCRLIAITDMAERLPPFLSVARSSRGTDEGEILFEAREFAGTPAFRA